MMFISLKTMQHVRVDKATTKQDPIFYLQLHKVLANEKTFTLGMSRFTSVSQYIDTQLPQYASQG